MIRPHERSRQLTRPAAIALALAAFLGQGLLPAYSLGSFENPTGAAGASFKVGGARLSRLNGVAQVNSLAGRKVHALVVSPADSDTVYAGTDNGLYISTNAGAAWSLLRPGLAGREVRSLAVDPARQRTVYAVTATGIFRSADGGATWVETDINLILNKVEVDPHGASILSPSPVYLATIRGVYKSTDGGVSWSLAHSDGGEARDMDCRTLAFDPRTPSTVYTGTRGSGVFKSADAGRTWRNLLLPLIRPGVWAIAVDPRSPATLYASAEKKGVFKSTDGGRNWREANGGRSWRLADNSIPDDTLVLALAVDPRSPSRVYAGTDRGLYMSADGGGAWRRADAVPPNLTVLSLTFDPRNPSVIYAGTSNGVFKSTDGGVRWS